MTKTIIAIFTLFLLSAVNFGQTDAAADRKKALDELTKLSEQTVAFYKEKKYDQALGRSLEVWRVAETNGLAGDVRVLPMLRNLGEIYLTKGKETEALAAFQKVLAAYEALPDYRGAAVAELAERIGAVYF